MKTVIHLFRTENRKLRVLLGIYAVCWALFQMARAVEKNVYRSDQSFSLLWLIGSVVLAALCLGDNLVRPNTHWRIRPITWRDWLGARALFVGVWFVVPVAVLQFWMARECGLSIELAAISVVEALLKTLAFVAVVAAIAAQVPNGFWVIGLGIGLFVIAMTGMSFPNPLDSGEAVFARVPEANGQVWVWFWLACLGLGIGNLLVALAGADRAIRFAILGGSAVVLIGLYWGADANDVVPGGNDEPETEWTLRSEAANPGEYSQGIYRDLHLHGPDPGVFAEITELATRSGNYRQPDRAWGFRSIDAGTINKRYADESLIASFPRDFFAWRGAGAYYGQSKFLPWEPVSKELGDEKLEDIEIRSESFRWIEVARLPIQVGATGGGQDIFAEIVGLERGDSAELWVRLWRPSLHLAPRHSAAKNAPRWRGFSQIAFVVAHEELNEIFLLRSGELRDGSRFRYSQIPFSGVQQATGVLEAPRVHAWRVLWPDVESDFEIFMKWAEGAELRIYGTEYVGPVSASFEES